MELRTLRVFVSSPGDVGPERGFAHIVLQRLAERFAHVVRIEPIFWEHEPLLATQSFQEGILSPAETDIVVCILWARLGTRLPPSIRRPDGSTYASGTEFEFETAAEAHRQRGVPDLLVYLKQSPPQPRASDPASLRTFADQWASLKDFVNKWFHGEDGTLVAAFHPFEDSAGFEQLLEINLRKQIEKRLTALGVSAEAMRAAPPPSWTAGSPFRGLEVFEFEHAPVFCGRAKGISEVLAKLRPQSSEGRAFLLILGPSGCGKSSLVRAGVLPMLTQPGVMEGVGLWRRSVLRPAANKSGDLFDALAAALADPTALPELMADGTSVERLAAILRKNPPGAYGLVKGALSQAAAMLKPAQEAKSQPEARLVLVIDQLEEVFTDARFTAADRQTWFVALADLAHSGKVWVIATLRSDFYHRCQEIPDLAALKEGDGQLDLLPPTPAEIGKMIRDPALAAGIEFDFDEQTGQSLDDVLQNDAAALAEGLPLLEFALDELYRHATANGAAGAGSAATRVRKLMFDDYRALHGLSGCLAERAEQTFRGLEDPVQAVFAKVFRKLIVLGGGEDVPTRRIAPMSEFLNDPVLSRFVDQFVAARLFTADRAVGVGGEATVRIAHEVLVTTAEWPRLRDWLTKDRENLKMHGRLAVAASRWHQAGRTTDLVLQPGRPLEEARQLRAAQFELSDNERALIEASERQALRRVWLRRAAVGSLAFLAVATAAAALVANNLRIAAIKSEQQERDAKNDALTAKNEAVNAKDRADKLAADKTQLAAEKVQLAEVEREARRRTETMLYLNRIATADRAWQASDLDVCKKVLEECQPEFRGWEWNYLQRRSHAGFQRIGEVLNEINAAAFSDNGKLATAGGSTPIVWIQLDAKTRPFPIKFEGHTGEVRCLAFNPDGNRLASGSGRPPYSDVLDKNKGEGEVKIWELGTRNAVVTIPHSNVNSVAYSPDGKHLATASGDKTIGVWNALTGEKERTLTGHDGLVSSVAFSPDGEFLASGGNDGMIRVWNASDGTEHSSHPAKSAISALAFSPDGKHLASGGSDQTILVWKFPMSDRPTLVVQGHTGIVTSVAFMLKGQCLVSGSADRTVRIWDAEDGTELRRFRGHRAEVTSVAVSPGDRVVVSTGRDWQINLWDVSVSQEATVCGGHQHHVHRVAFSSDGKRVASTSDDETVKIWDTSNGNEVLTFRNHSSATVGVAFSPDGKLVASGSGRLGIGEVLVWEAHTGKVVHTLHAPGSLVESLAISPDGRWLASADRGSSFGSIPAKLIIWDLNTDQPIVTVEESIESVAFGPNGKVLATADEHGTVKLREARTAQEIAIFGGAGKSVAFSPDGKWLASGGENGEGDIKIWDLATGQTALTLAGRNRKVYGLAFSPDSARLASASGSAVILWDMLVGAEVLSLNHGGFVRGVAFSPDGRLIASAGGLNLARGRVKIWDGTGLEKPTKEE